MPQSIGPVMLDLVGTELNQEEREILQHPSVGGVVLFTRNYVTPKELKELCQDIRNSRDLPLLIAVDHEGGRVQRFRQGFTRIPSMGQIGRFYENSPENSLTLAEISGWIMASELLSFEIDLSFAPVLDLNKEISPVIGDRAFHRKPAYVIELAKAIMAGMHTAGMAATGKHFPGHGSINFDSHFTLPVDRRSFDEMLQEDIQPFIELINMGIDAIMPAHIVFPRVDDKPVGFSAHWLQTVLRHQYKFSGMIVSDDLNMKGADFAGSYSERAESALEAGCEMILICNNREGAVHILDRLPQHYFLAEEKFKRLQGKFSNSYDSLRMSRQWRETQAQFMRLTESFAVME